MQPMDLFLSWKEQTEDRLFSLFWFVLIVFWIIFLPPLQN